MKKYLLIAILVMIVAGSIATPVYATTYQQPSSGFAINQVEVYKNCVTNGDNLMIISFEIGYPTGTLPTEPIDTTYLFRLTDNTTSPATIVSTTTTYGYANNGYGTNKTQKGIASFYFSAANALTWASGNYTAYFEGNPTLSWNGTTPSVSFSPFTLWYDGGTTANTRDRLTTRILYLANLLQTDWGWAGTTPLLQTTVAGQRLSSYGETYFIRIIPNLRQICPNIFYQSMSAAQFEKDTLVLDYYVDNVTNALQTHGVNWYAQTFVVTDRYAISGIQVPIYRVGNPGNIDFILRATIGGIPTGTGTDLASSSYNGTATLTTDTNGQWIASAFTSDYQLNTGDTYAIIMAVPTGNAANYVGWCANNLGHYAGGQECSSVNSGGAWAAVPANDCLFELLVRGGASLSLGNQYKISLFGTVFDITQIAANWGIDSMWLMTFIWLAMAMVIIVVMAMSTNAWNCWWIILNIMVVYGWRAGFCSTDLLVAVIALSSIGIVWGVWFKRTY